MARQSKASLIDATLDVVRAKGYTAARVEDICAAAEVTKGSFFHHFETKDDLALAAAERWRELADALFADDAIVAATDPLDRLFAYLDLRKRIISGDLAQWTCFAGTTIQEVYATHPRLRDACAASIEEHTAPIAAWIDAAMHEHEVHGDWTAASLALHIQVVLQGAFVLAKAKGNARVALDSIDHLRRYVTYLFRTSEMQA